MGLVFAGLGADLIEGDVLFISREGVILGEEQHTVALFALLHGNTGAVPVNGFNLGLLVLVMATGAQGRTVVVFVLGQAFDHNRGNARVGAEVSAGTLGVTLREVAHHF